MLANLVRKRLTSCNERIFIWHDFYPSLMSLILIDRLTYSQQAMMYITGSILDVV